MAAEKTTSLDWYSENIESGVRDLVRFLRDNGVNTECSCEGHVKGAIPYVQCQYITDGEIHRIHRLLTGHGYENFIFKLFHLVVEGHPFSTLDIYVGKSGSDIYEKKRQMDKGQ